MAAAILLPQKCASLIETEFIYARTFMLEIWQLAVGFNTRIQI